MKKAISGIAELTGVILVVIGLIVCMCDTTDVGKQLLTMLCGAGIMVVGVGFGIISVGVRDGRQF